MRKKPKFTPVAVALLAAVSVFAQADQFPYKIGDMPFNAKAVHRTIDTKCPETGYVEAKSNTAEAQAEQKAQEDQNKSKNNFGLGTSPVPIQVKDFDKLEKAYRKGTDCAKKHKSKCQKIDLAGKYPVDRSQLKNIVKSAKGDSVGEGTLVVLEAHVMDSHYSDSEVNKYPNGTGEGESVNCKGLDNFAAESIENNDIHIVLGTPSEKDKCKSVTAEISPHYRPEAWRHFHNMPASENDKVTGVDLSKIKLVRITGPLMYDASHEPCTSSGPGNPKRRSVWEIHPVYKLEVQTATGWESFEKWYSEQ
ncbi:MAG: hypothetical protein JO314_01740 [Acidobacteria bacterium]|nr:hypothetical protein [Acidobacteriota bacterium]